MANLSKKQLFSIFERSLREDGWNFLYLSDTTTHPRTYQIFRDDKSQQVRIYIWNLTPGGKHRPTDEWRIQVTSVDHFVLAPKGKTLILGWWAEAGVFAGFDIRRHQGNLGKSPSIQLRKAALDLAAIHGFAPHRRETGELAIAFRPDFLGTYIENLTALHDCGAAPEEFKVLEELGDDPSAVGDEEIAEEVPNRGSMQ